MVSALTTVVTRIFSRGVFDPVLGTLFVTVAVEKGTRIIFLFQNLTLGSLVVAAAEKTFINPKIKATLVGNESRETENRPCLVAK